MFHIWQIRAYRAYKFNFASLSTELPKTYAYGTFPEAMISVYYISWNGATEVTSWNFHAAQNLLELFRLVGNAINKGFVTVYMSAGYAR